MQLFGKFLESSSHVLDFFVSAPKQKMRLGNRFGCREKEQVLAGQLRHRKPPGTGGDEPLTTGNLLCNFCVHSLRHYLGETRELHGL